METKYATTNRNHLSTNIYMKWNTGLHDIDGECLFELVAYGI